MADAIEGRVRELIEGKNFVYVGTIRKDGSPAVNPTWVDVEDGLVVLNSAEGRAWPRNLRRDGRVTLTVTNAENPYEYAEIRGHVVDDTHDDAEEHIDRMAQKYLGQERYPLRQPGEQRVKFKIAPDRVFHNPGG